MGKDFGNTVLIRSSHIERVEPQFGDRPNIDCGKSPSIRTDFARLEIPRFLEIGS